MTILKGPFPPKPHNRLSVDGLPTLSIDPVTKAAAGRIVRGGHCACLDERGKTGRPSVPDLHVEPQDEAVPGWAAMLGYVEAAAREGSAVLEPSAHVAAEEWAQVITLPRTIETLQQVKQLRFYGSHLRRLPPEIGRMEALEDLDIYTSYSFHWLPYEVTRCRRLRQSRMSTRALYGNRKTRLPFPRLTGPVEAFLPETCSVCDHPFGETAPQLYWITLRVGTDVVPLLVHSCSRSCTQSLPSPPEGYHPEPHQGGGHIRIPDDWPFG